jgi:hypothetical protein
MAIKPHSAGLHRRLTRVSKILYSGVPLIVLICVNGALIFPLEQRRWLWIALCTLFRGHGVRFSSTFLGGDLLSNTCIDIHRITGGCFDAFEIVDAVVTIEED